MYVFIGCSSRNTINNIYIDNIKLVSTFLAKAGFNLITGGIDGNMGVAQEKFANYGRDILVLEVDSYKHNKIDYKYTVCNHKSISLRKQDIINKADLFVIMPGGIGTLDEIFTLIESKRAKEHDKHIIILNINNYYDNLIKMLDDIYDNNFASIDDKKNYYIVNDFNEFTSLFYSLEWKDMYDK